MYDLSRVSNLLDWPKARVQIEKDVLNVLGALPKERVDVQVKTMDETQFPAYVRRRVNYFVDEWERVSAWLFIPEGRDELPAIVCCHDLVAQGKNEPAGMEGDPTLAFAQRYAEMGYVTLAPDCITIGDRVPNRADPFDTKPFYKDNPKQSAIGKMLWDHIQGIDMLAEFKRVDSARIGVIGHGFGAVNALYLAAFDERIQGCVASCGFTRMSEDDDPARWYRDEGFSFLPKLKAYTSKNGLPFDWEHILALAAPNPTLVITAENDEKLPQTSSCSKAVKDAKRIYELLGAGAALSEHAHLDGHRFTSEAQDLADDWFERWL